MFGWIELFKNNNQDLAPFHYPTLKGSLVPCCQLHPLPEQKVTTKITNYCWDFISMELWNQWVLYWLLLPPPQCL